MLHLHGQKRLHHLKNSYLLQCYLIKEIDFQQTDFAELIILQ